MVSVGEIWTIFVDGRAALVVRVCDVLSSGLTMDVTTEGWMALRDE